MASGTDIPLLFTDASSTVQTITPIPEVNWDNIQIVETHDDEGRIELVSKDQLCEILGLKDEEERSKTTEPKGRRMVEQAGDTEGPPKNG